MTRERDEALDLAEADARFVARLREEYAPEAQSAGERLAFTRSLESRLERSRRGGRLVPALAGVGLAAALAWLALSSSPAPEAPTAATPSTAGEDWAVQILFADDPLGEAVEPESDAPEGALPAEYVAIASVFLDE